MSTTGTHPGLCQVDRPEIDELSNGEEIIGCRICLEDPSAGPDTRWDQESGLGSGRLRWYKQFLVLMDFLLFSSTCFCLVLYLILS